MRAPDDHLLRVYLDARAIVANHLDDPTPVVGAWTAQRAAELLLVKRGWSDADLDGAFERDERAHLLALDIHGWRAHLVDALARSTDRSVRVAQALARYHEPAGGVTD